MKKIFDLNYDFCVACGACSVACMDQNDIDPRDGEMAYRLVQQLERKTPEGPVWTYLSMACMHCADAPCVKACPSGCIKKDPETGFTIYDNTNCISCHSCAMACPFGAPRFNKEGKMEKCDGCNERVKAGLKPACVKVCPYLALKLYDEDEYEKQAPEKSLKKLADEIFRR